MAISIMSGTRFMSILRYDYSTDAFVALVFAVLLLSRL